MMFSASQAKEFSPEEFRARLEKESGKRLGFFSAFPVIGRGNVLRDGLVTSDVINKEVDKILGL